MNDAPERIWAMTPDIGEYWAEPPVNVEDSRYLTEYIRADLATRQRGEAVAAAYEAARNTAICTPSNYAAPTARIEIANAIDKLTPTDATAALEARDARVWNEAMDEVLSGLKKHSDVARKNMNKTYGTETSAKWSAIIAHLDIEEDRIRALKKPTGDKAND